MKTIYTEKAPAAIGSYSQAKIAGDLIFTSGQIPINPATSLVEGNTIEEQTDLVCRNIKALLEAANSNMDKVIKTVCFLADMNDFTSFNSVYEKYFTSKPARSCVAVKALPKNVLVEIEAIAEI